MWRMSSSSSTMIIQAPLRIMSIVSDVRPAVPTRAQPTPSSPQETCDRHETLSGCWRKHAKQSILNCFSLWTQAVEEAAVAECVTVAATLTTLTWCTRRSVIGACAPLEAVGAKTAAAASAVTAAIAATPATETAPLLPPTGTEAGITETTTTRAQISTRTTTAAAVAATTLAVEASPAAVEVRISRVSRRVSLARLLHHQGDHSPWWLSSLLHHSPHSWASWGNRHTHFRHLHLLPPARHLPGSRLNKRWINLGYLCVHRLPLWVFKNSCNMKRQGFKWHISKEVRAYIFYLFCTF